MFNYGIKYFKNAFKVLNFMSLPLPIFDHKAYFGDFLPFVGDTDSGLGDNISGCSFSSLSLAFSSSSFWRLLVTISLK